MRILIYGAGNIGCLYAAKLTQSGQDVTILARGERIETLRSRGITLENGISGERTTTSVCIVDRLDAADEYDLILVVLPKPARDQVLPILAANEDTPNVMFFGNDAAGPEPMISALGHERVLLGFPGAAAVPHDDAIRYVVTSRQEQPTTIGEPDGEHSERIKAIARVLKGAGFPVSICTNMDAWLKTHAAKILATAGALYYAGGHAGQLATNNEALRLMVRAIRESLAVLRANGIPITPPNHRVLQWLPESPIVFIMKRMFSSETMAIKVGHAEHAQQEFQRLAQEFRDLNTATRLPTPTMDRLFEYFAPAAGHEIAS
jgi:2-dehydropantoate 2-reductase